MIEPFGKVKNIIIDLQNGIGQKKQIRDQIMQDNPGFEESTVEKWENEKSRCLIHAATDVGELIVLECRHPYPPLSEMALMNAKECVAYWCKWLEQTGAYYEPFEDFEFDEPLKNETLREFIIRMVESVESEGIDSRLEWRALKSFLDYLRQINHTEWAFVEHLFPKKMDIFHNRIIRKIPPKIYPISEILVGKIILEFMNMTLNDRPNAQHTAAEGLGFAWLCLAAARLRLPVHLKTKLYFISSEAISFKENIPYLSVPTLFGDQKIRISHRLAEYLLEMGVLRNSLEKNLKTTPRLKLRLDGRKKQG